MLNDRDKDKIDSLERVISSMRLDHDMLPSKDHRRKKIKSALCDNKPSFNLKELLEKTLSRYPLLRYLDDYNFGYKWKKKFAEGVINYLNIIDCTFHTENIFEEVDRAKKKAQNIVDKTYETLTKNKELVKI
jgi:hypothetical protein